MFKILRYIIISISLCLGYITKPQDGSILNYRDILVTWNQAENAKAYEIEVYNNSDELLYTTIDSTLATIVSGVFDWDSSYSIRLKSMLNNEVSVLIDEIFFSINVLTNRDIVPFNIPAHPGQDNIDEELYFPGYNFIDDVVIDKYGEVVLYMAPSNNGHFTFTNQLDNGNFIGIGYGGPFGAGALNVDGTIVYETDINIGNVHHDFYPMGNGNFLGLVRGVSYGNVPDGTWNSLFEQNGITQIGWEYDIIAEFDPLGNEVWSWSTNDYFTKEDFDPNWFNYYMINNNFIVDTIFDWTHCNAVFFDPQESVIYLSSRHLSRIVKISYPDGNIEWMVGKDMASGEVLFGDQIDIAGQHAIKLLDNGNLMLFNNGNFKDNEISKCIEFQIEEDNNQLNYNLVWEHTLPEWNFSRRLGDCDRLPNGNTLITSGDVGYTIEVDSNNNTVWETRAAQTHTGIYRSERIDGIYPLITSITVENFKDTLDSKYVYIPEGESYFKYKIHNEGYNAYTYVYSVEDELGLIDLSGEINLGPNDFEEFVVPINVPSNMNNNLIEIKAEAVSVYTVPRNRIQLIANSCYTNPDYIYSDMGECPSFNNLAGDFNQDGQVNVVDVISLVNIVLSTEYNIAYDLNDDGIVNVLDIIDLINIILN